MKRYIVIILILAVCLIVLISCSAPLAEPTTTPIPTAAPTIAQTVVLTPEPMPEPSPEPSPEPFPTPYPIQVKYEWAPEIEGLKKEIREKDGEQKVVYLYEEDNPYGGVAGEYAGEFKMEVYYNYDGQDYLYGGISLSSSILKWGLPKGCDFIDSDPNKVVPIPIEISTLNSLSEVIISLEVNKMPSAKAAELFKVEISNNDFIPIRSVLPNEGRFLIINNEYFEYEIQSSLRMSPEWLELSYDSQIKNTKVEMFPYALSICSNNILDLNIETNNSFGEIVGKVTTPIYLYFNDFGGVNSIQTRIIEYTYFNPSEEEILGIPPIRSFFVFIGE